jgi:thymidine kinase
VHARDGGRVEVVTGSMFSGKTEELLRRVRRSEIAGQGVVAFTPSVDDRYGESSIGSHEGRRRSATSVDPDDPGAILDAAGEAPVVAVDEANFFEDGLVDACERLADDGRRVVVAGTDQTFRGEPFSPLPRLMALADSVEKRQAVCATCGAAATRNQRLVDGDPAPADAPTIAVGAEESYEPRCRDCHVVPGSRVEP